MTSGTVLKTRFSFVQNNRNYTNAMVTMVSWPAYNQPNGLIISHLVYSENMHGDSRMFRNSGEYMANFEDMEPLNW